MSDMTSPNQTDALNSFSFGSILDNVWDATKNTFNNTIHSIEGAFIGGAAQAAVAAQNASAEAKNEAFAVPVSVGLNNNTIFLVAGVVVVGILIFKK